MGREEKTMSGFLTDADGNKSSKRLLQVIATISGIVLGYIAKCDGCTASNS